MKVNNVVKREKASFILRALAYLLDQVWLTIAVQVIIWLIFLVGGIVLTVTLPEGKNINLNPGQINTILIVIGITVFIWCLTYAWFLSSNMQATPGKKLLRIKVVNANGNSISYLRAFVRTVLPFVCFMPLIIALIILPTNQLEENFAILILYITGIGGGLVWLLWYGCALISENNRTIHDCICSTYVIKSKEDKSMEIWELVFFITIIVGYFCVPLLLEKVDNEFIPTLVGKYKNTDSKNDIGNNNSKRKTSIDKNNGDLKELMESLNGESK